MDKWGIMKEDDYAKAKRNRKRVANKENIEGYLIIEHSLAKHNRTSKKLPKNIVVDWLPQGGGKHYRRET
tara:strand:+ start:158 stop:367 length:210 start_codon:yes stop_codon:yes gene_type:complete